MHKKPNQGTTCTCMTWTGHIWLTGTYGEMERRRTRKVQGCHCRLLKGVLVVVHDEMYRHTTFASTGTLPLVPFPAHQAQNRDDSPPPKIRDRRFTSVTVASSTAPYSYRSSTHIGDGPTRSTDALIRPVTRNNTDNAAEMRANPAAG
ncbi:hypothetical protein GGI42DRAFT_211188 [Trichoderma sp. SZMC 28013]